MILFCKMFIVFYTEKIVYICVIMVCSTSKCFCDSYGPTECIIIIINSMLHYRTSVILHARLGHLHRNWKLK